MKVGAGGLQIQSVHDEVANRQTQESRRTDYQQKPIADSDNTKTLNSHALNKTVEKTPDAAQTFDLPLRLRRKDKDSRENKKNQQQNTENNRNFADQDVSEQEKNSIPHRLKLDQYI